MPQKFGSGNVECGQYLVDDINNVEGIKYIDLF
jgi:hypothetical protein